MPQTGYSLLALLAGSAVVSLAPNTNAAGWTIPSAFEDGVYGRLKGNLELSLKLGRQIPLSPIETAAISVGTSLHYYSMLGLTLDLHDNWEKEASSLRRGALGLELRPLFLPRWLLGRETGPALLDLTVDSMAAGWGIDVLQSGNNAPWSSGSWLSLGAGLPLLGTAWGPWLEVRAVHFFQTSQPSLQRNVTVLNVFFSWHDFLHWDTDS